LNQASPEDLIRHFLDVGQYFDTPSYSQSLLDEIATLTQQRDHDASLASERDSLAASVQILTDEKHQFQLEQDRFSELHAIQHNDLELCSRERAELQADRAALQAKLGEQESVTKKMITAIQNLFPHEHYRALHPDLNQASPEDLIRHFLDVGQYLDTPPYSQSLLDEISTLAQQRDQSMAKLSVLEANFEHMATEIATFKDLFARLISKAAAPALSSAP
jgi:chromosome segregation ATPase